MLSRTAAGPVGRPPDRCDQPRRPLPWPLRSISAKLRTSSDQLEPDLAVVGVEAGVAVYVAPGRGRVKRNRDTRGSFLGVHDAVE